MAQPGGALVHSYVSNTCIWVRLTSGIMESVKMVSEMHIRQLKTLLNVMHVQDLM